MSLKPITWLGDSNAAIRAFPKSARCTAGDELYRLQIGRDPENWKPMGSIGVGVREIRISNQGQFRIIYVIDTDTGPVVLHAFKKTTQKTSKPDINIAKQRFKEFNRSL